MNTKKQTTIAILRTILPRENGSIEYFSELLGISKSYLQKLESGSKPITADLAERVSGATGVSRYWLLSNRPSVPPICTTGLPYTYMSFIQHKALQQRLASKDSTSVRDKITSIIRGNGLAVNEAKLTTIAENILMLIRDEIKSAELELRIYRLREQGKSVCDLLYEVSSYIR